MPDARVVIVTGGAYGIGRAIASRFCMAGDRVIIADINSERGEALAAQLPGTTFRNADMREPNEIEALVAFAMERLGRIDVLCANAGIERYASAEEYSLSDWSAIIDTNLRGAFLCAKYALPHLKASRGSIVFTSSVQAIATEKQISVYAASKSGLLGLTRGIALDYAPEGVRVNAVCPGATQTGMMETAVARESDPQGVLSSLAAKIPLRRLGLPEDVAHAVYFLASPEASYITGTQLVVDGGLLAGLAL
ncbi:MAG TPA: SDR family NAD(P)-dependent oxidoreductase [Bryobacteraceae bacterium]|jgi:NAD(P)-dependent dehydrogenase (short-subunit alcohol dehydrogenase family)|nr:SDR family NAD(P)-dependent oxidoreductase [Bryobacteraceae bacterium]